MIAAAVVDASVAVKWVVEEPDSGQARMLARARLEAPDLMAVECANILWKKARIGDIDARQASERLDALLEAPVALTPSRDLLGRALGLALALARGVPLVTADERLARAVRKRRRAVGVTLLCELS